MNEQEILCKNHDFLSFIAIHTNYRNYCIQNDEQELDIICENFVISVVDCCQIKGYGVSLIILLKA